VKLRHVGTLSCVSVFSGGMGLDLGLEKSGFDIRLAADSMLAAIETIKLNRPRLPVFESDIRDFGPADVFQMTELRKGQIDLLAGGPPCQSFSTAGKRLGLDDESRGPLVFEFARLIDELQPRAFLMENVKGLLSASIRWRRLPYNNNGKKIDHWHGSVFRELSARIKGLGYSFDFCELNAADYGVPQTRLRVFLIGYRDGAPVTFPEPSHSMHGNLFTDPWRTIGDVLNDLKKDDSHCNRFSERKVKYLKMVPPGGNWRDLPKDIQRESMGKAFYAKGGRSGYWRRLSFDEPSPTILTEPQNASTSLCHPILDRPLTVRECARIQTFPDDWLFHGRGKEQYMLVGNAVPVDLAANLGRHIRQELIGRVDAIADGSSVDSPEQFNVVDRAV
jgi:DNA (cytosine-5)-methyltransferase 1